MITNIELTDQAVQKFNNWFDQIAKDNVRREIVMFEMLDVFQEHAATGESFVYELGQRYTLDGKPSLFNLSAADIIVTGAIEPDE